MLETVVRPTGPYLLRLTAGASTWSTALPGGGAASAWQRPDGDVVIRATSPADARLARFVLALDDDTGGFHERFARDPLLGPTARALVGWRPLRTATVTEAAVRAVCGQLVTWREAKRLERGVRRLCGTQHPTREQVGGLPPARLCALGLSAQRSAALVRLCRTVDLERLRSVPGPEAVARLRRERGIGPWSVGVVALHGLGRYDHGIVGDLGLIKLATARLGRVATAEDTGELLAPYGEWQGLAGSLLLLGWTRGLVPGADPDVARHLRTRARRAA